MTQVQAAQPRKLMEPQFKRLQSVVTEVKMDKVGQAVQHSDCLGIEADLIM
ncbi:hypothetical protein D3C81_834140 [compost metagenome]